MNGTRARRVMQAARLQVPLAIPLAVYLALLPRASVHADTPPPGGRSASPAAARAPAAEPEVIAETVAAIGEPPYPRPAPAEPEADATPAMSLTPRARRAAAAFDFRGARETAQQPSPTRTPDAASTAYDTPQLRRRQARQQNMWTIVAVVCLCVGLLGTLVGLAVFGVARRRRRGAALNLKSF